MRRTVMVVADNQPVHWLCEADTLSGASVMAGFSCAVSEVFEGIARATKRT